MRWQRVPHLRGSFPGPGYAAVHFTREGSTWAGDKAQHPVPHLMTGWAVPLRLASNPGA
ncbi:hypothetical protein F2Q69_00008407 [Brassica cretica]|uniref:Uncharacterized protein n=1 Tax=Brassica cretica TaxID=69181 RepID=A0A8S9PA66_BRACR|nr:hypothetical protein F2Q69_00008407 [Brassica cretica]